MAGSFTESELIKKYYFAKRNIKRSGKEAGNNTCNSIMRNSESFKNMSVLYNNNSKKMNPSLSYVTSSNYRLIQIPSPSKNLPRLSIIQRNGSLLLTRPTGSLWRNRAMIVISCNMGISLFTISNSLRWLFQMTISVR